VLEIPQQKIQSKKCLILITCGSTGIKSLLYVPKGMKHNTTFFDEPVVPGLAETSVRRVGGKHFEALGPIWAMRHRTTAKSEASLTATKAHRIPAPAYSPDLSPSDSFSFGMLKERMWEYHTARHMN
jgi:hypothetical protein